LAGFNLVRYQGTARVISQSVDVRDTETVDQGRFGGWKQASWRSQVVFDWRPQHPIDVAALIIALFRSSLG